MGANMHKWLSVFCCAIALSACDKHDPILPGVRTPVFDTAQINVQNKTITQIPNAAHVVDNSSCPYTQDSSNVIWDGPRKIFSGFPTGNTVSAKTYPVCSGKYLYAGLTTGELVKLNPKTRQIIWIADIYRTSNMTGGASMVDIIAPIVPYKNAVYAGSLGDAFCRISAASGDKQWCVNVGVGVPFVIADSYAFVVATDSNLYAISLQNGDVYWRQPVKSHVAPIYQDGKIIVGDEWFSIENGKKVLDK